MRPSGSFIVNSFQLVRPCLRVFSLLLSCYYCCVCFFILFHSYCSHASGILCEIYTPCMGSSFSTLHTRLSVISRRKFFIMTKALLSISQWVYHEDNNIIKSIFHFHTKIFDLLNLALILSDSLHDVSVPFHDALFLGSLYSSFIRPRLQLRNLLL